MDREILYLPAAQSDLDQLYEWIADRSDPDTALSYITRLDAACRRLHMFPNRGTPREELKKGLRTIAFERRAVIAFLVDPEQVQIVRILHGGRDLTRALGEE